MKTIKKNKRKNRWKRSFFTREKSRRRPSGNRKIFNETFYLGMIPNGNHHPDGDFDGFVPGYVHHPSMFGFFFGPCRSDSGNDSVVVVRFFRSALSWKKKKKKKSWISGKKRSSSSLEWYFLNVKLNFYLFRHLRKRGKKNNNNNNSCIRNLNVSKKETAPKWKNK